jgi:hypothetical protein
LCYAFDKDFSLITKTREKDNYKLPNIKIYKSLNKKTPTHTENKTKKDLSKVLVCISLFWIYMFLNKCILFTQKMRNKSRGFEFKKSFCVNLNSYNLKFDHLIIHRSFLDEDLFHEFTFTFISKHYFHNCIMIFQ